MPVSKQDVMHLNEEKEKQDQMEKEKKEDEEKKERDKKGTNVSKDHQGLGKSFCPGSFQLFCIMIYSFLRITAAVQGGLDGASSDPTAVLLKEKSEAEKAFEAQQV